MIYESKMKAQRFKEQEQEMSEGTFDIDISQFDVEEFSNSGKAKQQVLEKPIRSKEFTV